MNKTMMTAVAAVALGLAGTAHADGQSGSGDNSFSYSSTWGSNSGHTNSGLQGNGGTTSDHYGTTCGTGGWDAPGGGIPSGCTTGAPVSSSTNPIGPELPNAQPGQCFARIVIPAVYDDVPQTVTSQEGYETLDVTEAQFAPDNVNIQVRDAGVKYVVRQPRYEARTEQVLVRPAYERLTVVPAQFSHVSETVTVGQPRLVWKPGRNLSGVSRVNPNTGAVYCLVEEPAQTVSVQKRVMSQPEQVRTQTIPAQYTTVTKQVLTDPGGVDQIPIPAEYRDIAVQRLSQPAQQMSRPVAPQTRTVMTKVLRSPERFDWVPVLCNTNATHSSISRIQSSLAARGYYNGRVDGIAGHQTSSAISSFQSAQGIPHKGYLTVDTLNALGVGDLASADTSGSQPMLQSRVRRQTRAYGATLSAGSASAGAMADYGSELARSLATEPAPAATSLRRRLSWDGKN
ncbi:MAG: peptidoglycan-binding domain-containing protein [Hyphomonadaceae bacterium]